MLSDIAPDHTAGLNGAPGTQPYSLVDARAGANDDIILYRNGPTPPRALYTFAVDMVGLRSSREDHDVVTNGCMLPNNHRTYVGDQASWADRYIVTNTDVIAVLAYKGRFNHSAQPKRPIVLPLAAMLAVGVGVMTCLSRFHPVVSAVWSNISALLNC